MYVCALAWRWWYVVMIKRSLMILVLIAVAVHYILRAIVNRFKISYDEIFVALLEVSSPSPRSSVPLFRSGKLAPLEFMSSCDQVLGLESLVVTLILMLRTYLILSRDHEISAKGLTVTVISSPEWESRRGRERCCLLHHAPHTRRQWLRSRIWLCFVM